MVRIIKETIIMLLICLVGMLIFAVAFYQYIPNRKVVPNIAKYEKTKQIEAQLADNIDSKSDDENKTRIYEVTVDDLDNYIEKKDYIPGKADPFAAVSESPESGTIIATPSVPGESGNSTGNDDNNSGNKSSNGKKDNNSKNGEQSKPTTK